MEEQLHTVNLMQASTIIAEDLARRLLPPPAERRRIRRDAGVSLRRMAGELGVTPQAVDHWEHGRRHPRADLLIRYEDTLRRLRLAALVSEVDEGA